ncbi:MAG: response regulator [Paracoccaceae bacterium]|nr:response regulator [Paracoccaceae bacterium]
MAKRILLVEDEPNIIEAIRFILSRDGWHVSTHSDGRTAVDEVARVAPDVVVLDVMLPGRSGFDILRDLRAAPQTHALPVLMLTAKGQGRDREQAERYGVTRFMTKPFANSEVLEAVNEMMAAAARQGAGGHGGGTGGGGAEDEGDVRSGAGSGRSSIGGSGRGSGGAMARAAAGRAGGPAAE